MVILSLAAIGLIAIYFVRNSLQKADNINTVPKIDKIVVKEVKTDKLSVGKAEIKKARIKNAKIKKENVRCQEVRHQCAACSHGKVHQDKQGSRNPLCRNKCSYNGQRRCVPGCLTKNQYQVCGNYDADSCLEWSKVFTCSSDRICKNGLCIPKCISHAVNKCYNNDIYWYNSCGDREEKYKECGADSWTENYQCSGGWLQREKRKKGCVGLDCYNYLQWENYQNCSDAGKVCRNRQCVDNCLDECYYAGQRRCVTGFENQYQVCGNYDADSCLEWSPANSCPRGQMCQNGQCMPKCISHYSKVCYNDDVYWYNSCGSREEKYQECGADSLESWSANYCFENNVYRKRIRHKRGCFNNQCYSNSYEDKQLVQKCNSNEACQAGECVCISCRSGSPGPDPP